MTSKSKIWIKNSAKILISIIFLTQGCVPSSQFSYVRPDYQNRKEFSSNVMVMQFIPKYFTAVQKERFYEKQNAERKYLSRNETDLFDNYMPQLLSENTQVKILKPDNNFDPEGFLTIDTQDIKDRKVELYIPSNQKQNFKLLIPDYIILFTDLYFQKDAVERGVSMGQGTKTYYSLNGGIEYIIWNYKKKELVGYGKQEQKLKLLEAPEKEDYLSIMERFAAAIVQNSPFASKKVYF